MELWSNSSWTAETSASALDANFTAHCSLLVPLQVGGHFGVHIFLFWSFFNSAAAVNSPDLWPFWSGLVFVLHWIYYVFIWLRQFTCCGLSVDTVKTDEHYTVQQLKVQWSRTKSWQNLELRELKAGKKPETHSRWGFIASLITIYCLSAYRFSSKVSWDLTFHANCLILFVLVCFVIYLFHWIAYSRYTACQVGTVATSELKKQPIKWICFRSSILKGTRKFCSSEINLTQFITKYCLRFVSQALVCVSPPFVQLVTSSKEVMFLVPFVCLLFFERIFQKTC